MELVFIYWASPHSIVIDPVWAGICRRSGGEFLLYPFPCLKSILLGPVHRGRSFCQHHIKASFQHPPAWFRLQPEPFFLIPSLYTSAPFPYLGFWFCDTFFLLMAHPTIPNFQHCFFSFTFWFFLFPPSFLLPIKGFGWYIIHSSLVQSTTETWYLIINLQEALQTDEGCS